VPFPARHGNGTSAVILLYSRDVSSDVWVGAATTLAGAVLGGAISFLLGWQQAREARRQRQEDDAREHRRRSVDRRFQAYADFLTRTRSFRNAVEIYYLQPGQRPSFAEIDSLLQSANDASALVFLVVGSDATYEGCRNVLRALQKARAMVHESDPAGSGDPWKELNSLLGRATREFQNSARIELEVSGPIAPWNSPALDPRPGAARAHDETSGHAERLHDRSDSDSDGDQFVNR
jgi:hypothetical protein